MNQMKGFSRVNRFIALLLAISFLVLGTVSSVSAGAVVTASGDPINGALVTLRDYTQYNTTSVAGVYTMSNVPIGKYFMWTTATGYAPNITSINVTIGENTKNITMELCRSNFTDVSCGDWHYAYVFFLYDHAITTGTSPTTFSPDVTVTRAQTATFIARAKGLTYSGSDTVFPDVPPSHWAYNSIMAARQAGIIGGYANGYFGPDDPVTRGQIAKMVTIAGGMTYTGGLGISFPDVPNGHWAYNYVMAARQNNIISGYANGNFGVDDQAMRSHMAKMITNMMLLPP